MQINKITKTNTLVVKILFWSYLWSTFFPRIKSILHRNSHQKFMHASRLTWWMAPTGLMTKQLLKEALVKLVTSPIHGIIWSYTGMTLRDDLVNRVFSKALDKANFLHILTSISQWYTYSSCLLLFHVACVSPAFATGAHRRRRLNLDQYSSRNSWN